MDELKLIEEAGIHEDNLRNGNNLRMATRTIVLIFTK